jgi:hypothetical protein
LTTLNEAITQNPEVDKWFNMLQESERSAISRIINHILGKLDHYNNLIPGFEAYITGSSLNLQQRSYNDIDVMVVLPKENLEKLKLKILSDLKEFAKNQDLMSIQTLQKDPTPRFLGLEDLFDSILDSLLYSQEIASKNKDALVARLGSTGDVNRILLDPEGELSAIKVQIEGIIDAEKPILPTEIDETAGFQFGPIVEKFLKDVVDSLIVTDESGSEKYKIQWYKSFLEGYGKVAGENNCYIQPPSESAPVHLFLSIGVDQEKAMQKKESFMLEYYTDQERMQPVKIY